MPRLIVLLAETACSTTDFAEASFLGASTLRGCDWGRRGPPMASLLSRGLRSSITKWGRSGVQFQVVDAGPNGGLHGGA
jgi:hypothetical protein